VQSHGSKAEQHSNDHQDAQHFYRHCLDTFAKAFHVGTPFRMMAAEGPHCLGVLFATAVIFMTAIMPPQKRLPANLSLNHDVEVVSCSSQSARQVRASFRLSSANDV
jgi:hypothetical protein